MLKYTEISTLVVVTTLILSIHVGADDKCKKLKNLDYQRYGTKTMYRTARQYLDKADEKHLPKSFDDDTLEEEHKDLAKDSCMPVVFYFIGRHAARFPDGEDIELYNKKLSELKEILKKQTIDNKCPKRLEAFLNWTTKMEPKHDNLITELGAQDQQAIAKRFKKIYPEFFNTDKTDVKIGVTNKIRTAQTGMEFLKEVDGLRLENCDKASLPTHDLDDPRYDLDRILQNACYKAMMDKYNMPVLEFHKQCDKINGKEKVKIPLLERVKDPSVVKDIAERVTKKLGLSEDKPIDAEMLDTIFDMCKFENGFKNYSVWCSLFEKKDIQLFEYIEDFDDYIKDAYGSQTTGKQACPMVKDLVDAFQDGTKLTGAQNEKRKAYYYFSHAGAMKKLLAAFDIFQDADSYSVSRAEDLIKKGKVDDDREWQSSLIAPFSANMAFVLYRCQKQGKPVAHKILATVTEQPVKLGRCSDTACSSRKFFETYNSMRDCDMNRICARSG